MNQVDEDAGAGGGHARLAGHRPPAIEPQVNGPLHLRGNMEIVSGTGRVVSRVTSAYLCRWGGSSSKPFCDGTHARIRFVSGPPAAGQT